MRFVSFLVFVTRAGRSEQAAFAARRRLASDRSLTLTTQFWAQDTDAHTVHVVDESAEGGPRVIATRTAAATVPNALLNVVLPVPPLATPGAHQLLLEVDGERVMSSPIDVTVREVARRGQRSRYKGRGALTDPRDRPPTPAVASDEWQGWPRAAFWSPETLTSGDVASDGVYLRHGELFPVQRSVPVDGRVSGLWIAAYFAGFAPEHEGPHLVSVTGKGPGGENEVLGVRYFEVTGPRATMRVDLDPVGGPGAHTFGLAIDGGHMGELSVSL